MASRRLTTVHKLQKPVLGDSNTSKDVSEDDSSEAKKKTKPAAKVIKSRYLQPVDKKPTLKTSANESSGAQKPASPKPDSTRKRSLNTPPRRSLACQSVLDPMSLTFSGVEPSVLGGTYLQSTILDGHCVRPDFDLSTIKEKIETDDEQMMLENQTFLLAYLTAKMESNTQKLKSEAEWSLLAMMEEEEKLRKRVQEKKRQYLLMKKRRELCELLDLQSAALAPVSTTAKQFTQEYKTFATAVDSVRHELPIKNFHTQGDKRDFLENAEACLQESEGVLLGCVSGAQPTSEQATELLQDMKRDAEELEDQLSRMVLDVLELVPQVSRQTVQIQQSLEEERMGMSLAQELFHPKQ